MNNRIIVFEKFSLLNLFVIVILNFFHFKVFYLKSVGLLSRQKIESKLITLNIVVPINYEDCKNIKDEKYSFDTERIGYKIYNALINDSTLSLFSKLFSSKKKEDKLKVIVYDTIQTKISKYMLMLCWADASFSSNTRIYIFAENSRINRLLVSTIGKNYHFVIPAYCFIFINFLKLIKKAFFFLISFLFKKKSKKITNATKSSKINKRSSDFEIVYFPHKGIYYGDMFLKDHYYSNNIKSPFHSSKILHLELAGFEYNWDKSIGYYNRNNIPYMLYPALGKRYKIPFLISYLLFFLKNIYFFLKNNKLNTFFIFLILKKIYLEYKTHNKLINTYFSDTKIALIGYDVLIPKILTFSFDINNIRTVAIQERFLLTFANTYNVLLDTYLVSSNIAEKFIKEKKTSYVRKIITIGFVRSDLLLRYNSNIFQVQTNKHNKLNILAFDYHSAENIIENRLCSITNWENNYLFYNDLIKLATQYPQISIAVRSKFYNWMKLNYFNEILKKIEHLENIWIDNYDELDRSYELAYKANMIIAKHTSIGDECLAIGKPVLYHDYYNNTDSHISNIFNYNDYPVFVHSYEELEERVRLFIDEGYYMDKGVFEKMKEEVFGNFYDGKVKERLHNELMKIYNEC